MSPAASLRAGLFAAPPSKPAALYAGRFGGLRCFSQGFGSAVVAYSGAAASAAPGAAPVAADFTSLDAFTLAVLDGRLTGPAQILAALALFLTAHHSMPRTLGLLTGLIAVLLHMQGVTLTDALALAGDGLRRLAGVLAAAHVRAAA